MQRRQTLQKTLCFFRLILQCVQRQWVIWRTRILSCTLDSIYTRKTTSGDKIFWMLNTYWHCYKQFLYELFEAMLTCNSQRCTRNSFYIYKKWFLGVRFRECTVYEKCNDLCKSTVKLQKTKLLNIWLVMFSRHFIAKCSMLALQNAHIGAFCNASMLHLAIACL